MAGQQRLRRRLHRHEAHVRAGCRLADRCGIGRTVLATLAGHAVGRDEVACNQPRIQPIAAQLACPVMRTAAGLRATRQPGGNCAHRAANLSAASALATTTRASTACT